MIYLVYTKGNNDHKDAISVSKMYYIIQNGCVIFLICTRIQFLIVCCLFSRRPVLTRTPYKLSFFWWSDVSPICFADYLLLYLDSLNG